MGAACVDWADQLPHAVSSCIAFPTRATSGLAAPAPGREIPATTVPTTANAPGGKGRQVQLCASQAGAVGIRVCGSCEGIAWARGIDMRQAQGAQWLKGACLDEETSCCGFVSLQTGAAYVSSGATSRQDSSRARAAGGRR